MADVLFYANFAHLNGCSAIYYTYMWSQVIATDMFSQFEFDGVMNKALAKRYRDKVLATGGSKPAAELVRDFLGSDYSFSEQLNK
jgi:thimet oligopeptidase